MKDFLRATIVVWLTLLAAHGHATLLSNCQPGECILTAQLDSDANNRPGTDSPQPGQPLNLNKVDIQSLIALVSARTGKNFIIDPRVKANVTVISAEAVSADQLYDMFISILQVHGFAAVPSGAFVKIVPTAVGVQSAVPLMSESEVLHDALITQVIRVDYAAATQLIDVVRPLLSATAGAGAVASANTLVVTDHAANISKIAAVIRQLDRPR